MFSLKKGKKQSKILAPSSVLAAQEDDNINEEDKPTNSGTQLVFSGSKDKEVSDVVKKALEEDPTIFDYDLTYDDDKRAELEIRMAREGVTKLRDAKYMDFMRSSAIRRKLEDSKVKQRRAEREMEEEFINNPELADGEVLKFETAAFKEHKAELEKLEAEEKRKEEEEAKKKDNMLGFQKELLDDRAALIEARIKRAQELKKQRDLGLQDETTIGTDEVLDVQKPAEIKTDQLKSGLNIIRKPTAHVVFNNLKEKARVKPAKEKLTMDETERDKVAKDFEKQVLELQKQKEDSEKKQEEEILVTYAKKTSEDAISEAKRKALERKRKREEENAKKLADSNAT